MSRSSGIELLAQQVGDVVASEVYKRATSDYLTHLPYRSVGATPIEKLFAYALEAYVEFCENWSLSNQHVLFCHNADDFVQAATDERAFGDIYVEQQVDLGGWRVDFIVHRYNYFSNPPGWLNLVVECDGHDFHERTKEQAARDRARDRAAVINRIAVMRFTGSELWNNPLGCAKQVIDWIDTEVGRSISDFEKSRKASSASAG
jgi:very-short-patch-repair endonuclease